VRVLILSKAHVVGVYQSKLEELARLPGLELMAVVPPSWREQRVGVQPLERLHTEGYELAVTPILFNGHHHVHFYPRFWRLLRRFRPDVVHVDDEPFNLVTLHAAALSRLANAKVLFFTWQNLERRYPPPFRQMELVNYRLASHAVAGNQKAADVLRRKGYRGPLTVIPQFGVDPLLYAPGPDLPWGEATVGFVGRLVPEKGVGDLLAAFGRLPAHVRLEIVGTGEERPRLEAQAATLGVGDRVTFRGAVPPAEMPEVYRSFSVLVIPSRTRPNWKEQFGRVIVEAMACGVPIVGSDSGEIPNVIGVGGLVYPEGDVAALAARLNELLSDDARHRQIAREARQRVLGNYTQARIAERYYDVYQAIHLGSDE
jgi:glycosyltransferase involved in cell wall biosynthesis